jgi:DNA repair protein RadC
MGPAPTLKTPAPVPTHAPVLRYARPPGGLPILKDPDAVAVYLVRELADALDDPREHAYVLSVSSANRLIYPPYLLSVGQEDQCDFSPREILRFAIVAGGTGLILAHTHPSGKVDPNPTDIESTRKVQKAAEIVGLAILDHLILGGYHREAEPQWYSFRKAGLL